MTIKTSFFKFFLVFGIVFSIPFVSNAATLYNSGSVGEVFPVVTDGSSISSQTQNSFEFGTTGGTPPIDLSGEVYVVRFMPASPYVCSDFVSPPGYVRLQATGSGQMAEYRNIDDIGSGMCELTLDYPGIVDEVSFLTFVGFDSLALQGSSSNDITTVSWYVDTEYHYSYFPGGYWIALCDIGGCGPDAVPGEVPPVDTGPVRVIYPTGGQVVPYEVRFTGVYDNVGTYDKIVFAVDDLTDANTQSYSFDIDLINGTNIPYEKLVYLQPGHEYAYQVALYDSVNDEYSDWSSIHPFRVYDPSQICGTFDIICWIGVAINALLDDLSFILDALFDIFSPFIDGLLDIIIGLFNGILSFVSAVDFFPINILNDVTQVVDEASVGSTGVYFGAFKIPIPGNSTSNVDVYPLNPVQNPILAHPLFSTLRDLIGLLLYFLLIPFYWRTFNQVRSFWNA